MASLDYVESEIRGLPQEQRPIFQRIFQHVLKDLRIGHPADQEPSQNFGGAFYEAVTPSTPGDEFTIAHGMGRVPYLLIPVLPLDVVGAQIVPLAVSRAADDKRVYLTSTASDIPITVFLEG